MKIKLLLCFFIFSVLTIGEEIKFNDLTKDHWAYKSIQNLVDNKIIDQRSVNFNGNLPISRYQFAYELSKLLTKIDTEKIDKKEIDVLRSVIYDFSAELNEIGFNYSEFNQRLSNTEESIDTLKRTIEVNNIKIKELEKRLKELEKKYK